MTHTKAHFYFVHSKVGRGTPGIGHSLVRYVRDVRGVRICPTKSIAGSPKVAFNRVRLLDSNLLCVCDAEHSFHLHIELSPARAAC